MKQHLLLLGCLLLLPLTAVSQGNLNPPGGPGPTMKSLDQLDAKLDQAAGKVDEVNAKAEKRIPISSLPFTITQPGSYYVTGNLTGVANQTGITVEADDITIDLNGFALVGSGAGGKAIDFSFVRRNVAVRNGTIRRWALGMTGFLKNAQFEKLLVSDNSADGIRIVSGSGITIKECVFVGNGSVFGSALSGDGMSIIGCTVRESGGDGISVSRSTITACSVSDNAGDGIEASSGSSISDCVVRANGANGINVISGVQDSGSATISRCISSNNTRHGIVADSGSLVLNNECVANGAGTTTPAAGIRVTGAGSRIEGNNTVNNDIGIQVAGSGNIIIKNSSRGGTDAYDIAAANSMGQETDVFNPNATTVITSSNPWANFLY